MKVYKSDVNAVNNMNFGMIFHMFQRASKNPSKTIQEGKSVLYTRIPFSWLQNCILKAVAKYLYLYMLCWSASGFIHLYSSSQLHSPTPPPMCLLLIQPPPHLHSAPRPHLPHPHFPPRPHSLSPHLHSPSTRNMQLLHSHVSVGGLTVRGAASRGTA